VNSIVILVDVVKMKFILTFLCCKKIIHIFFDLYEGMWRNQRLGILSTLGITIFLVGKEQYLFFNNG
jgi:hypothetical protein